MINEAALETVAGALTLEKGEKVLEIGPGLGFLTQKLLERGAEVWAIDKDPRFIAYLNEKMNVSGVHFVNGDILEFDPQKEIPSAKRLKVIGNIPYNITSLILEWLIEKRQVVGEVVLTVQAEVAERLSAKPGTKAWGCLSLFLQVYADVEILKRFPADIFYPPPNVTSAVIKLHFHSAPRYAISDPEMFFFVVRKAFQKRRKTLLNALKDDEGFLTKDKVQHALIASSIDPMRRPETLAIDEWISLLASIKQT